MVANILNQTSSNELSRISQMELSQKATRNGKIIAYCLLGAGVLCGVVAVITLIAIAILPSLPVLVPLLIAKIIVLSFIVESCLCVSLIFSAIVGFSGISNSELNFKNRNRNIDLRVIRLEEQGRASNQVARMERRQDVLRDQLQSTPTIL